MLSVMKYYPDKSTADIATALALETLKHQTLLNSLPKIWQDVEARNKTQDAIILCVKRIKAMQETLKFRNSLPPSTEDRSRV